MAFTYGAGTGTQITSYCVEDTLPAQTDQTGSNTVVVTDDITTLAGAANLGDGTTGNGPGVTYVGRLCVLRIGLSNEETRLISVQTDLGGGATVANSWRLTVSEDWTEVPASSDTFDVFHTADDVETGSAGSGGVTFQTRTGFFEWSNELFVGGGTNKAGIQILGELWELEDSKSTTVFPMTVRNNGRFQSGYIISGQAINGGYMTGINNSTGEPWIEFLAGSEARLYDWRPIAAINPLQIEVNNGTNDIEAENFSIYRGTDEAILIDSSWKNGSITGSGATTDIVRLDAGSTFGDKDKPITLIATAGLHDNGTGTETIETREVIFVGNLDFIVLDDDKTWDMIDPVWTVTSHTDINDTAVAGTAAVNVQTSVTAVVQEADGTKLQNALINVYEHTQLADLVLELTTDADGLATGVFDYRAMSWTTGTGSTTTYGGHALQCGKWLYLPLVFAQSSSDRFDGTIVLADDTNIVQTVQATALTAGASVTWNEDTNASEVVDFTSGSGTLAVGMIITYSPSGAVGTITESLSGDSTAGEFHLKDRNATAIGTTQTFTRTGGTAGSFSGTHTDASEQPFSIWVDAATISYQALYDFIAAKTTETTLSTMGELIWEWCRSAQTQALYSTGSSFYTAQSNSKGIMIVNAGGGTLDYVEDDTGTQWNPPASVSVSFEAVDSSDTAISGVLVTAYRISDDVEIINTTTDGTGFATTNYTESTPVDFYYRYRKSSTGSQKYVNLSGLGTIESSTGSSIKRSMTEDDIADPSI